LQDSLVESDGDGKKEGGFLLMHRSTLYRLKATNSLRRGSFSFLATWA
jgi:hypothetical protein